jgi:hypothetical protein
MWTDPVLWSMVCGAGMLAGVSGFALGRRGARVVEERAAPVAPRVDPKLKELELEVGALRDLMGASDASRYVEREVYGGAQSLFKELLAEALTHKVVKAACILSGDGLVLSGEQSSRGEEALASLLSAARALDPGVEQVRWGGDRGDVLAVYMISAPRRQRPLFLGVWTKGAMELPKGTLARIKYRCGGLQAASVGEGALGGKLTLRDEAPRVVAQVVASMSLMRLRVLCAGEPLLDLRGRGAGGEREDEVSVRMWRWGLMFGARVEELGLGRQSWLVWRGASRRVVGLHSFEARSGASVGAPCLLWLEQDAEQVYPDEHISSWTGQLMWQLGELSAQAHDRTAVEMMQRAKSPEAVVSRGGAR